MSKVTVYISTNCPYCQQVLDFLEAEAVDPAVKNISEDQEAYVEWKALNPLGTPLTCVKDKHVLGANTKKLAELISQSRD